MQTARTVLAAAFLFPSSIAAHGVHAHDHTIETIDTIINHHSDSKVSLYDFFSFVASKTNHFSLAQKMYSVIDAHYLASAVIYNFLVCLVLSSVFYVIPIAAIISRLLSFLRKTYTDFLNKYGYLRDFESDDPTINSTTFNIVGVIMNWFKESIFDSFDFENLFNFFMLAGFFKELFLELFYSAFVYSTDLAKRQDHGAILSFLTSFKQNETRSDAVLKNISSLAQKIMFSYIFFYVLDRFINILLISILKLDADHSHTHSHSAKSHELSHYLDDLNEKLAYQKDIKSIDVELDVDSHGHVLRSYSTTTFDDGSLPENEEYSDSEDGEYVAESEESDFEDSDFEIDDFEIEQDADNDLHTLSNLKFVILNIINDFILNINSGISLYNLFGKQRFGELKIFIIVWALQYASHVVADSIYMLNKTTPMQFVSQLLLSNFGVVVGILFKHLSKKQAPIMASASHYFAENHVHNYLLKLFGGYSYTESTALKLENAKVASEYWIVQSFYTCLNKLLAGCDAYNYEMFLLAFQIGFTMFLIFNKILPETKAPTSVKELLVYGSVAYLGFKAKA